MPRVPPTPRKTPHKKNGVYRQLFKAAGSATEKTALGALSAAGYPGTAMGIRAALATARAYRRGKAQSFTKTAKKGKGGIYHGRYGGKFKAAVRKTDSGWTPYARFGYVDTQECNGLVADPNCVYVGHTAQATSFTIVNLTRSLIRQLFYKCINHDAVNYNEEIPGFSFSDTSNVFKIDMLYIDVPTGTVNIEASHTTADNDTIDIISNTFKPFFYTYSAGANSVAASNTKQPYKLEIYVRDGNTGTYWDYQGCLNLNECMVHVKAVSEMKIQNRSLSATGSANIDQVNNNPIHGYRYVCNGMPRSRDKLLNILGSINGFKGVITKRAAELDPSGTNYVEPPLPKTFVNIDKSSKVKLDPGDLKKSKLWYEKSMGFNTFLRKLQYLADAASDQIVKNLGQCEVFALEDQININSTENIQIAYEVNRKIGTYVTFKAHRFSTMGFVATTQSNEPA